jgi:hypothetical protein
LGPEARQLVIALEIFIASLLDPPSDQYIEKASRKGRYNSSHLWKSFINMATTMLILKGDEVPEEGKLASIQSAVVGDTFSPAISEAQGQLSCISVPQDIYSMATC